MESWRMEFSYTQLKLTLAIGLTCFILTIAKRTALWLPQLMAGITELEYFVSNTKLEGYFFLSALLKFCCQKADLKTQKHRWTICINSNAKCNVHNYFPSASWKTNYNSKSLSALHFITCCLNKPFLINTLDSAFQIQRKNKMHVEDEKPKYFFQEFLPERKLKQQHFLRNKAVFTCLS